MTGARQPSGEQIVLGWIGSVAVGFVAWRAFDEKAGRHSKVVDGWGYTPRAHTAFAIGAYVGSTLAVWSRGRARGATGSLFGTAVGAALPTAVTFMRRDDPLFPFMMAILYAPLQGIGGYLGYRATARTMPETTTPVIAERPATGALSSSSNVVIAADLRRTGVATLFDAVRQLRPNWFTNFRAGGSSEQAGEAAMLRVYVDGILFGEMQSMRQIAVSDVLEVRYLSAVEATSRFGTGNTVGAIAVTLGRP